MVLLCKSLYILFNYNREYFIFYKLIKLDNRLVKNIHYKDYLREFWSYKVYLILLREETIKIYTKIHYKRDKIRLYT